MMLIMSIVCLLKTLNRYIWLAESLCSVNYVEPYMFSILKKIYMIMAHFTKYWLFLDWFQVMSVVSWLVPGSFRWLQVVTGRFSFYQIHRPSWKQRYID